MQLCINTILFLGDYRQEVCAVPEVEEEEVLVRTLAVGICAGDAKCFAGAPYFWGEPVSIEQVYLYGDCEHLIL